MIYALLTHYYMQDEEVRCPASAVWSSNQQVLSWADWSRRHHHKVLWKYVEITFGNKIVEYEILRLTDCWLQWVWVWGRAANWPGWHHVIKIIITSITSLIIIINIVHTQTSLLYFCLLSGIDRPRRLGASVPLPLPHGALINIFIIKYCLHYTQME